MYADEQMRALESIYQGGLGRAPTQMVTERLPHPSPVAQTCSHEAWESQIEPLHNLTCPYIFKVKGRKKCVPRNRITPAWVTFPDSPLSFFQDYSLFPAKPPFPPNEEVEPWPPSPHPNPRSVRSQSYRVSDLTTLWFSACSPH